MNGDCEEVSCPVPGRLICLLEAERRSDDRQAAAFLRPMTEIERDALLLGVAPGTRALIPIAWDVMMVPQTTATRTAGP